MRRIRSPSGVLTRNSAVVATYAFVVVLFLVGTAVSPAFATIPHIRTLGVLATFIGIVGLGQTLCILTGGVDLSIPQVMTGSAIVLAVVAHGEASRVPLACAIVFGLALGVGVVNGIGVAYAGVPPIIMTLGANGALQGFTLIYTHGGISTNPPGSLITFAQGDTIGVPSVVLVWLVIIALGVVLLTKTSLGRQLYAVGANRTAARLAGVPVRRVLVFPYVASALGAALAGIFAMGYYGEAYLGLGDPYLFASAVAVVVGGTSVLGGQGGYIGTVAGALLLTVVGALLGLFGLTSAWLDISYGFILLIMVFLAGLQLSSRGLPVSLTLGFNRDSHKPPQAGET